MLPYWHGSAVNYCVRPPAAAAAAVDATASTAVTTAVGADTADCYSYDSGATDAGWYWMHEDRLQRTPMEQRMLDDQLIEEQADKANRIATLELSTFPTWCDFLSMDTLDDCCRRSDGGCVVGAENNRNSSNKARFEKSPEPVAPKAAWRADFSTDDYCGCFMSTPPPPPMPPSADYFYSAAQSGDSCCGSRDCCHCSGFLVDQLNVRARAQANNSNLGNTVTPAAAAAAAAAAAVAAVAAVASSSVAASAAVKPQSGQAVASGRTLSEIEAAVEHTRNNSNQQQRYEMRGGHAVEICSRVLFPDRLTRDVSVTVEATHSNSCHRVIMLKGLTAKKRPDLGPKVKDCRLRMDQIVMTRPNASTEEWQKSITMSYDSDFQVGIGEERNRAL